MKRYATVLGVVFLIGAFALPVMAHGPGPGAGYGPGAKGNWAGGPGYCWDDGSASGALTAEQQGKMENLSQKFYDETAQTRDTLWSKMGELNRLFNSENPDAEKAKALQKEISDLRAKMAQARIEFELEERKIAPQDNNRRGSGRGYGPGMRGNGSGMRGSGPGMGYYGHHMGGYGPGMRGYGPAMGYYGHHMGGYGPGSMGPGWHHRGGYGPESCWR
jgi:zinc resistance-associated protein